MFKSMLKGLLKKVGEEVMDSSIGDKLRQAEAEVNAQLAKEMNEQKEKVTGSSSTTYVAPNHTAYEEKPSATASQSTAQFDTTDEECALSVPAEDGPRGEFSGMDEKQYSYLIPKDEGFIDEGNCHAFEIHQAYGFGKEINYSREVMMYFSIAPEFDCEIKESRPKAAFTRYDGAPSRSKLMTLDHPFFTHAYLFESSKIYRISYLKQISESELLACELALKKSGRDAAFKAKMIEEFKRFAGSCREA